MEGTRKIGNRKWSVVVAVFLVVAFTFALFAYTVEVRRPWFGKLSPHHHQWLTGSTVKFTRNWYREGAWRLKFAMFEEPRSVEFPNLGSRDPYMSYPPGTIIPIYVISELRGSEPGPGLVMSYNLANHFLIALFLALTAFFFLYGAGFGVLFSFTLALVPPVIELLMPAPLYWHQNVFFSDQAVILPIALFLFLEVLRDHAARSNTASRILTVIQGAVLFYGALTDWLFFFVAAAVFLKRLLRGEFGRKLARRMKSAFFFCLPAFLAVCIYGIQVCYFQYDILGTFLFRSGLSESGSAYTGKFYQTFWNGHVAQGYGKPAVYILWLSLAASFFLLLLALLTRLRKRPLQESAKRLSAMAALLTIPFFAQIFVFKNHSAIHDFSALKFSLTLALVPFVLLPCIALLFLERKTLGSTKSKAVGRQEGERENAGGSETAEERRRRKEERDKRKKMVGKMRLAKALVAAAALVIAATYAGLEFPRYKEFFPEPGDYTVERFVADHTAYEDVVFSAQYEIPANPPQQLSYSMKRIYKVESVDEIYEKVAGIEEEYVVGFLAFAGFRDTCDPEMRGLFDCAEQCLSENDMFLYKVGKESFLRYFRALREGEQDKEAALALASV